MYFYSTDKERCTVQSNTSVLAKQHAETQVLDDNEKSESPTGIEPMTLHTTVGRSTH